MTFIYQACDAKTFSFEYKNMHVVTGHMSAQRFFASAAKHICWNSYGQQSNVHLLLIPAAMTM